MKKILIFSLAMLGLSFQVAYAEKIPVRLAPSQIVSTNHDEIQVGDWIGFRVVNDVYVDDKLYIKKETPIVGVVDFFHQNGWIEDTAEIRFKTFYTTDVNNKKVEIVSPLVISGEILTDSHVKKVVVQYICGVIRGAEIYIEPDTKTFNIFITR